jgi:hypothetical protein
MTPARFVDTLSRGFKGLLGLHFTEEPDPKGAVDETG